MPEITILVAKQPMDKIPASLILFSKVFNNHDNVFKI